MRRAFTIIEVMVSVIIILFVGWGLLHMQENTIHNVKVLQKSWDTALLASPLIVQANREWHNKERTLYDFVKTRYTIKYDPMIALLKAKRFHYYQKAFSFIPLETPQDEHNNRSAYALPQMGLDVSRISIKDDTSSSRAFSFELVE